MIKECGLQERAHKVVGSFLAVIKKIAKKSHVQGAEDRKRDEQDNSCAVECSGGHVEHLLLEEQINAYCAPVDCISRRQQLLREIF